MATTTLVIEDDDGFRTEWPWPEDRLLLANGDFVAICEMQHDALREAAGVPTQCPGCQDCKWSMAGDDSVPGCGGW